MNGKRKLLVGVLVVLLLTAGVVWFVGFVGEDTSDAPDCSTVSYNGDGTETNPYEVSNVSQLQCIKEHDLKANYVQVSDIDGSETSSWHDGGGFVPIGKDTGNIGTTESYEFNGTYDGNGYNITNLTTKIGPKSDGYKIGMFSTVGSSGKVTNVSVIDIHIQGGFLQSVGGLSGVNRGKIKNSYVSGSVRGTFRVGGLVGRNLGGTINESYATALVGYPHNYAGGLVGRNDGGTINESYATGRVDGDGDVGGLVGGNHNGTIRESYATGRVEGDERVGGLVGLNKEGTINKSYYLSDLVGSNSRRGTINESESYVTSSVEGYDVVGGLVGKNADGSKINESYASVEGDERAGGLIAVNNGTVTESYWDRGRRARRGRTFAVNNDTVTNSYRDIEETRGSTSAGGTGLYTSQMTGTEARENMRGFDFTNTWRTVPDGYPALRKGAAITRRSR